MSDARKECWAAIRDQISVVVAAMAGAGLQRVDARQLYEDGNAGLEAPEFKDGCLNMVSGDGIGIQPGIAAVSISRDRDGRESVWGVPAAESETLAEAVEQLFENIVEFVHATCDDDQVIDGINMSIDKDGRLDVAIINDAEQVWDAPDVITDFAALDEWLEKQHDKLFDEFNARLERLLQAKINELAADHPRADPTVSIIHGMPRIEIFHQGERTINWRFEELEAEDPGLPEKLDALEDFLAKDRRFSDFVADTGPITAAVPAEDEEPDASPF